MNHGVIFWHSSHESRDPIRWVGTRGFLTSGTTQKCTELSRHLGYSDMNFLSELRHQWFLTMTVFFGFVEVINYRFHKSWQSAAGAENLITKDFDAKRLLEALLKIAGMFITVGIPHCSLKHVLFCNHPHQSGLTRHTNPACLTHGHTHTRYRKLPTTTTGARVSCCQSLSLYSEVTGHLVARWWVFSFQLPHPFFSEAASDLPQRFTFPAAALTLSQLPITHRTMSSSHLCRSYLVYNLVYVNILCPVYSLKLYFLLVYFHLLVAYICKDALFYSIIIK